MKVGGRRSVEFEEWRVELKTQWVVCAVWADERGRSSLRVMAVPNGGRTQFAPTDAVRP